MAFTINGDMMTTIATGAAVVGLVYSFFRDLKSDFKEEIKNEKGSINRHLSNVEDKIEALTKEVREENRKIDQRATETNKRMDGVYHILLKRSEGK